MLNIGRKLEYALIILKALGEHADSNTATARHLSQAHQMPFDTTSKVMQLMNNAGILKSNQGVKGGYNLDQDLSKVSYTNLFQIIEGHHFTTKCESGRCDNIDKCTICNHMKKFNGMVSGFLSSISIEDILETSTAHLSKKNG